MQSHRVKDYVLALISVIAATGILWWFRVSLDKAHIGPVYLLVVTCTAVLAGTGPALFAALLSFLAWIYFFIPPLFSLGVEDRRDWILLFVFLVIAALVGKITGQLKVATQVSNLREAERLKSVLFSSLSHNLKTPLASLSATLSNLRREHDDSSLQEEFDFMEDDIGRLTEHIDNLLNLAQLESGSWKPRQELVELQEVVSIALRQLPEREYNRITINIPETFPLVWVDSVQMSQVIRHLVENALHYSPSHSRIDFQASKQGKNVEFWLDDFGPGVSIADREQVFRKFFRGDVAVKKSVRGTGLGLAICHEIVEAHQGTICVEESPSHGARFRVTLPLKESKA